MGKNGVYILEVSSYQLELLSSIKFDIAILINISPDHISRHGSFRNYIKIKESIFKNQKDQDLAIIGIDDKFSYEIYKRLKKKKRHTIDLSDDFWTKNDQKIPKIFRVVGERPFTVSISVSFF